MECVVCGQPVGPKAENPSHPFCSARCKLVDLGKWLGEEYAIPGRSLPPHALSSERDLH